MKCGERSVRRVEWMKEAGQNVDGSMVQYKMERVGTEQIIKMV